jgi:hypothetical protein
MKLSHLDAFYRRLLLSLHRKGVPSVITGGLACVEFGVVEHTEDCDLVCAPGFAPRLLGTLTTSSFRGRACNYRSALSAPLAKPWLAGGWTSHFAWGERAGENPFLDVFGVPPRVTGSWQKRAKGFFADRQTVAEMKRTRRRKDWDQATALGLQMLKAGQAQGWLHIFDAEMLTELVAALPCPQRLLSRRPVLQLAFEGSPLLARAVQMEVEFWANLDRLRLKVYETQGRAYATALLKDKALKRMPLLTQHALRLDYAERLLPKQPLREHGVERLAAEARDAALTGIAPNLAKFLPEVTLHFASFVV